MKRNKVFLAVAAAINALVNPVFGVLGGVLRYGDRGDGRHPPEETFQSFSTTTYNIAAALTLTEADHAGRTGRFNIAAGVTVTLPRATGSGAKYRFVVQVTVTSVNDVIKVANTDDSMVGTIYMSQDSADTNVTFDIAADDDTITMNGSTKGGIKGDIIEIEDVATGLFFVLAHLKGTGTEATPMSAAV